MGTPEKNSLINGGMSYLNAIRFLEGSDFVSTISESFS